MDQEQAQTQESPQQPTPVAPTAIRKVSKMSPERKAMGEMERLLQKLAPGEQRRLLKWAVDKVCDEQGEAFRAQLAAT